MTGDIVVVNDRADRQAESVTGHDVKLPVEETTSQPHMLPGCIAPRDDDNFTSTAAIEDKSGMEEDSVCDGRVGPAVECASGVVRELGVSADELQKAYADNQSDTVAENTGCSSRGCAQHSVDASVLVHSIASESGTKQDANNDMMLCNATVVMQNCTEVDAVEGSSVPFPVLVPESEAVEESIVPDNELGAGGASGMDSAAESQAMDRCSPSSPNAVVAEPTENELIVEKLQEDTEPEEFETGMSVMSGECCDAKMKTDSDAAVQESSSQDEMPDAVDEMPRETMVTDLNTASECIDVDFDEGKVSVDESDSRGSDTEVAHVGNENAVDVSNEIDSHLIRETKDLSSAAVNCDEEEELVSCNNTSYTEVSCAGGVNSEMPVSVLNGTAVSTVIADAVQEAEDSVVTCESRFSVVKCSKELEESVNAYDKPAMDTQVICVRNMNVEVQNDASDENVLSVSGDEASVEVSENSESHCTIVVFDKDEESMDDFDKTALLTDVNCAEEVQAVEVVSCETDADGGPEAETSENEMQKHDELLPPQLAVKTNGEFLQMEDQRAEKFCSSTDVTVSCEAVNETEVCSTGDERESGTADSVLEHSLELEKPTDNVGPVVGDAELDTEDSITELNGNTLKQSDSCDSASPHEREQLKQPPGDDETSLMEMVAGDAVEPTVKDSVTDPADDVRVHLEAAVDHTAHVTALSDGEINVADEAVTTATSGLSPDVALETASVVGLQRYESAVVKEHESVSSVHVSVLAPESESESEDAKAVPVSLPVLVPESESEDARAVPVSLLVLVPESASESEVVEGSTMPTSEPVPESNTMEQFVIPMSMPVPECEQAMEGSVLPVSSLVAESEFELETVDESTAPVSALVPESVAVEGSVVPSTSCIPESELESEVVIELGPCTDRSRTDELELMLHEENEVMTASNVATDVSMPLEDEEMECDKCTPEDEKTVTSNVITSNSHAVDRLGKQVSDSSSEEVSVSAVVAASNNIKGSETEAQSAVCFVEQYEPKIDRCCSDPSPPIDVSSASSENALQHADTISSMADDVTAIRVPSSDSTVLCELTVSTEDALAISVEEDTAQSEIMISIRDRDATVASDRAENSVESVVSSSPVFAGVLENAGISEHMVQSADTDAISSEDNVESRATVFTGVAHSEIMISTRDGDAAVTSDGAENSVEIAVKRSPVFTDVLENADISEQMVQSADADAMSSEGNVESRVTVFTGVENTVMCAVGKDAAVSAKGLEDTVQSVVITSAAMKDTSLNAASCNDMVQSELMISVADEDTTVPVASSEVVAQDVDSVSTAQKDVTICTDKSESAVQSGDVVSVADEGTAVHLCDTVQRDVLISTDDEDLHVHAAGTENIMPSGMTTYMADNSSAENAVGLEDEPQSRDTISAADNDMAVHGESAADPVQSGAGVSATGDDTAVTVSSSLVMSQNGVMIAVADRDVTMVTSDPSDASDLGQCKEMTSALTDVCTAADPRQAGDITADAASQFNSQTSSGTVEEGQFDDVESDDNIEPATPMSGHCHLYRASPTLRAGSYSACHVSGVRRSLPPVSPSSFTRSPAGTPTSRHSSCTLAVTRRNTMSAVAGRMPRYSPLLSSPIGQNIERLDTRPRFPQSPIMLQTGGHPSGASSHVRANSPRDPAIDVVNAASSSGEKLRKRKRSADDADVMSKCSLVSDFAGDNATAVTQCDILSAENVVISSGCDSENATVTSAVEADTVDALTAGHCVSQALSDQVSPSQATDVCDAFPSQCPSQASKSETFVSGSQVNADPDVDGLKLYLELSQEPTMLGSQYVSHATKNVVGTLVQTAAAAGEEHPDGTEFGNTTSSSQPVRSLPCDDCSAVTSDVTVCNEGNAHVDNHGSVVDSGIPSCQEDTAFSHRVLFNSKNLNSDAEESGRPNVVEDTVPGFVPMNTDISIDTEVVEGMETNGDECLTVNNDNDNVSSLMDAVQPQSVISVADAAEKVNHSQSASSVRHVDLAPECDGMTRTDADDASSSSVTSHTSRDRCVGDYADRSEELLMDEARGENQPSVSSVTASVVEASSSGSCSLTTHAHIDPVDCVTDMTSSDNELTCSVSTSMHKACTSIVSPLSIEHSSCVTDSSKITCDSHLQADEPCVVEPSCNSGVSIQLDSERCNIEMHATEADTADALTADGSFASQCVSQALSDEVSPSQATDVCDAFPSQFPSQVSRSETFVAGSQVNANPDVDGLKLYLELSQEPSILGTSVCSQFTSQAAKNEVDISCSQTTTSSDAEVLHLYLEPSQQQNSLDMKLLEREDEVSTDGEESQITAGESDILMELRDGGISSQSTAGGLETTGEMDDAGLESGEDNCYDVRLRTCDSLLPHGLRQEYRHCESESTLRGCQENEGVKEQMTSEEDRTSVTGNTLDSVSVQSDMTDIPCESAILNSYDNVEESAERHALSVIAEEEDCDGNGTEGLRSDGDVMGKVDRSNDNGTLRDAEVTLMTVKACLPVNCDASVVVAGTTADGDDTYNNAGNDDGLDVTESMSGVDSSVDKDMDVMESSEKAVCSPLEKEKSDVCRDDAVDAAKDVDGAGMMESVPDFTSSYSNAGNDDALDVTASISGADSSIDKDVRVMESYVKAICSPLEKEKSDVDTDAAMDDDDNDGAGMMESVPGFGSTSEKDVDITQQCEKAVNSPVCTVSADDSSDNSEDDTNGLGVAGSTSDIVGSADKDVDVIRPSDNSAVYSCEVETDGCVAAADVGDPSDDDDDNDDDDSDSDVTASISGAGSDVGHLSDTEENAPGRSDGVSAVSPQLIQPLLTEHPGSVGDVQSEESFAGKYRLMSSCAFFHDVCLSLLRMVTVPLCCVLVLFGG